MKMKDFSLAFQKVSELASDFESNESKFLAPDYSEADVRKDFIDKFFNALGWDVYHNIQKNPYEQEVKIEKGVYVGKQQKRADYAFFIAPNFRDVRFYVEAKKPSKNLANADDYFQSCRYGWNAGTPITFLTDFEELHILDGRTKPDISSILNHKIKHYHYSDYLNEDKFAEIYWLISREAVSNQSIEKFSESLPKPKGKAIQKGLFKGAYQSIDEAFLEELDEIRNSLARSFKRSNPHLESEQLTEMTQRTIDRLVFIRFLEDKQIEPDHYVSEFANSKTSWKNFKIASRKLDAKYNGVVFKKHFIDSDNFVDPDEKTFSEICEEFAHVNSPYNFDIIPIHILGSIYERFLGKVVVATEKRVRIEEKPEVRKAGGVYYTPQYIVNYIVENTVGKLIEGKTPKEISVMRFADISCGSGSFLITVFDIILDYHRKWYQKNPDQAKKDDCILHDGKWVLSLKQKQKILT
ncbi:MAG: N-6 DNA methylase, partial [Bacteroidetes bacterium]|nr:N-6 DNA methylase [Bacteroidota bacterium]